MVGEEVVGNATVQGSDCCTTRTDLEEVGAGAANSKESVVEVASEVLVGVMA